MPNRIVCGDTEFVIDSAYRAGAMAMRGEISVRANPHRFGSYAYGQWDAGHDAEAAGEHARFGIDVIAADPRMGIRFEEDDLVLRDAYGNVEPDWYRDALRKAADGQPVDEFLRQFNLVTVARLSGTGVAIGVRVPADVPLTPFFAEIREALAYVDSHRAPVARAAQARIDASRLTVDVSAEPRPGP